MINQNVVEQITKAIWLYNADCDYKQIAEYLKVDIDTAVKTVQAANILEGIEL